MDEHAHTQSRQRFSTRIQDNVAAAIHDPELSQKLWNRARMFVRSITERYANSDIPLDTYIIDLHDLWYMIIEAAKITPADDAAMDRLAVQVICAREIGPVNRLVNVPRPDKKERISAIREHEVQTESAITPNGCMWTDLPFLATDIRLVWTEHLLLPNISRHNLGAFTARLIALGVRPEDLSVCALWVLRDTLEVERDVLPANHAADAEPMDVTVAELLPTVVAWFWYGGHRLLSLCAHNFEPGDTLGTSVGPKASIVPQSGFSMARWNFWKEQLGILSRCDNAEVAENSRKSVHMMERWEEIVGGRDHDRDLARNTFFS